MLFVKDFYEEKGVVAKKNNKKTVAMIIFGIVAVLGIIAAVLIRSLVPLVISLATACAFIAMFRERYVEYDYCFANDEIEISKIMNRKRRRTAISFNTSNIRFIAPENSIRISNHLAQYPDIRVTDYTSQEPSDSVYGFVLDLRGISTIIYLEPTESMMKHLRDIIPDKVLSE